MNERIKELAEEAQQYAEYTTPQGLECFDTFKEKFAELIVRECVDVLNKRYMGDQNREDMEVRRCIDDVKEHFGIE